MTAAKRRPERMTRAELVGTVRKFRRVQGELRKIWPITTPEEQERNARYERWVKLDATPIPKAQRDRAVKYLGETARLLRAMIAESQRDTDLGEDEVDSFQATVEQLGQRGLQLLDAACICLNRDTLIALDETEPESEQRWFERRLAGEPEKPKVAAETA